MKRFTSIVCTGACALALTPALASDDATAVLNRAQRTMGGDGLKSIEFVGNGTGSTLGQAYKPDLNWPKLNYARFVRTADYETGSLREEFARSRAEPNGGGAVPLMGTGEQRATFFVQGATAWNQTGPLMNAPAPVAVASRVHDLWTTPHGVLKAALKNRATVTFRTEGGKSLAAVSFTQPGQYRATAFINSEQLVERIESTMPHPVMGDTNFVTRFEGYRDHGGVKFPSRIVQMHEKSTVLDITVGEVKLNPAVAIQIPANVATAVERVAAEKVADGVWHLAGGSHNSVLIEMKDHLIVVEAPLYDGRSAAVLAEAKRLVPGKAVRYLVNSHHHFDHAGGLRTAAAQGATLVLSAAGKPFFDKVLANPNRIAPDMLAKSGKRAKTKGVAGKHVFTDGVRQVEVHHIGNSVHATGFQMVYLPKEKLLVEADAYTPGAPGAAPPAPPNLNHLNLIDSVAQLKLNVDRILPLHGRVVPWGELLRTAGK